MGFNLVPYVAPSPDLNTPKKFEVLTGIFAGRVKCKCPLLGLKQTWITAWQNVR